MIDSRLPPRALRSSWHAALRQLGSGSAAARLPAGGTLASQPRVPLYLLGLPLSTRVQSLPPPYGAPKPHQRDVILLGARRCRSVRAQPARKPS
ncbi:hypothetical protein L3V59_41740 [Burkholderia aenigmatica]|uniref:hypothetical protein n=1 Tax=Burkholderia aenigmatica TaxID=2015348 RepID=UPI001F3DC3F7|nr:hypothetical protein [Burkholderia aenigmatica]UKD17163.1 hypothetical protein L3V59_41740 [Burkholderia aenigmatica]